jgi:hypothetical protein
VPVRYAFLALACTASYAVVHGSDPINVTTSTSNQQHGSLGIVKQEVAIKIGSTQDHKVSCSGRHSSGVVLFTVLRGYLCTSLGDDCTSLGKLT